MGKCTGVKEWRKYASSTWTHLQALTRCSVGAFRLNIQKEQVSICVCATMWGCNQCGDAHIKRVLLQIAANGCMRCFMASFARGELVTYKQIRYHKAPTVSLFFNGIKLIIKAALWGLNSESHVLDCPFKTCWCHLCLLSTKVINHYANNIFSFFFQNKH